MAAEINAKFVGLEKSVEDAAKAAGRNLKINVGANARSVEALSQPLGRITGKADEFTKSMEAANARVLAFGASVGVLRSVTNSFKELVVTTIQVEKQMASINAILGASTGELSKFKKEIFDVARNTEQSFETVSTAALELSRQGLAAEEVVKRLNDSLILSRLSGQSAADAVAGLTSAINGFKSAGITSSEVVNKFSEAAKSAAVSERDLAEAFKRAGAVAGQAGVSFDELVGIVSAVQEKTSRGGSVIGNSFKTIFTRIQSLEKLKTMQELGVQVTNASGDILSATKIIQNLAGVLESFPDARRLQIAENLVGKFQVAPFISLLEDYNDETSKAIKITEISANATTAAYERNAALNLTLSAAITEARVNIEQLFDTLGKIGVTEGLQNILGFFNTLVSDLRGLLDEETGSSIAKGLVKGIGNVISGPGLAVFAAIIGKLTKDLVGFGLGSIRTFFGLNKAAKEQAVVQGQIAATLLGNSDIQREILKIENKQISAQQKKTEQTKFFTTALNEQFAIMTKMQGIATRVAPGVIAGTRKGRGAGGYIPNFAGGSAFGSEQADINRGVGGAPRSARPVAIPNFNFGGGQRGTMVANTSEFIVPNFGGGSAIFNQNMAASMGLPAGAKRVGAAGGYIPNFNKGKKLDSVDASSFFYLTPQIGKQGFLQKVPGAPKTVDGVKVSGGTFLGPLPEAIKGGSDAQEANIQNMISESIFEQASLYTNKLKPLGRTADKNEIKKGFETTRGAKGALMGAVGAAFEVAITSALDYKAAQRELGGDFDVRMGKNLETVRKFFGIPSSQNTGDFKVSTSPDNIKSFYQKVIREKSVGKFGKAEKRLDAQKMAAAELRKTNPEYFDSKGNVKRSFDRVATPIIIGRRDQLLGSRFNISKRSASGYIPNFVGALENAIGREAAAGIPINQIRINQKGTLRNSANPMGLAVTNTRDEPTGAIPNFNLTREGVFAGQKGTLSGFAIMDRGLTNIGPTLDKINDKIKQFNTKIEKGSMSQEKATKLLDKYSQTLTKSTSLSKADAAKLTDSAKKQLSTNDQSQKGQRDLLGTVFAVQMGLSLLSGATSDAEKGIGKFFNTLTSSLSTATTGLLAGSALTSFADGMKNSSGKMAGFTRGLGKVGIALGIAKGAVDLFGETFDQLSGVNEAAANAMKQVADSAELAAIKLNMLSALDQERASDETMALTDAAFGRAGPINRFMDSLRNMPLFGGMMSGLKGVGPNQGLFGSVNFEGFDPAGGGKLRKQLDAAVEVARVAGVDRKIIDDRLDTIINQGDKENTVTAKEATDTIRLFKDAILKVNKNIDRFRTQESVNEILNPKEIKFLQNLSPEVFNRLAQRDFTATELRGVPESLRGEAGKATQAQFRAIERKVFTSAQNVDNIFGPTRAAALQILQQTISETAKKVEAEVKRVGIGTVENLIKKTFLERQIRETNLTPQDIRAGKAGRGMLFRDDASGARLDKADLDRRRKAVAGVEKVILELVQASGKLDIAKVNLDGLKDLINNLTFEDIKNIGALGSADPTVLNRINDPKLDPNLIRGGEGALSTLERVREVLGLKETDVSDSLLELKAQEVELAVKSLDLDFKKIQAKEALNKLLTDMVNAETKAGMVAVAAEQRLDSGDLQFRMKTAASPFDRLRARSDVKFAFDQMAADKDLGLHLAANQAKVLRDTLIDASQSFADNITDGLVDAIVQGKSLGDTLRSAATDFFTMMSKAFMKQGVDQIVGGMTGGGGGIGNFLSSIPLVGGLLKHDGGMITGGSGVRDDVPALLTGGEFVMRKSAVKKFGTGFMNAVNQGAVPKFANGGMFTPGTFGQGAISGQSNLLGFATQTGTSTSFDKLIGGSGFAAVALAPESLMMTNLGRSMSPAFKRTQEAKSQAFGLFVQSLQADEQRKAQLRQQAEAKKQQQRGLLASLGMAALSGLVFGGGLFGGRKTTKAPMGGMIPYMAGGGRMIDRPMGGMIPYAGGGGVGHAAGVDTVPAMLSGGEFVMNAAATSRIGASNLQALNSGASLGSGATSVTKGDTNINIVVNSNGSVNQSSSPNTEAADKGLAVRLKDAVKGVIAEETRLGGMLSA